MDERRFALEANFCQAIHAPHLQCREFNIEMLHDFKVGGAEYQVQHVFREFLRCMLCGNIIPVCRQVIPIKGCLNIGVHIH